MIRQLVLAVLMICLVTPADADVTVRTVDLFSGSVNAAGPVLVQMDAARNRLVVANTLTSSLTVIDCSDHSVTNIPVGGRALQHLKSASMTIDNKTGDVYLIGAGCIIGVSVDAGTSRTLPTEVQFESVAVYEPSGKAFFVGRESKELGFLKRSADKISTKKWLESSEPLINLNQTPPPPIRRVIADNTIDRIIAIDGYTATVYLFDASNEKLISARSLALTKRGRWHFAGYDERDHMLYLVIETSKRKVIQAARIDVLGANDVIIPLPENTEGVGITYNPARREVYIPYDNHPSVHVVNFEDGGSLDEIEIPAFGNDAAVIDTQNDLLFVASWAKGEVDVIDLETRELKKRIKNLGIIPHMFTMAFNPNNGRIYYPKGASAVNGTFGAAVTALDPVTESVEKIHTGWAPIDLVAVPGRNSVFVFNNEDQFAEVRTDGTFETHTLPYDYPIAAELNGDGDVYVSYGPHQSYWPTVYIWGARNGILTIDAENLSFYDRRIPRQAHALALDEDGVVYFTQNNWGREEQFVGILPDPVRLYESGQRLRLVDEVEREITQRILEYDRQTQRLYLVRVGEKDDDPSILQVIDPVSGSVEQRIPLGLTATDLLFDDERIYVSNFGSGTVSVIDKTNYAATAVDVGGGPLKLCSLDGKTYVINHMDNKIREVTAESKAHKIPFDGLPNNLFTWGGRIVIASHNAEAMALIAFDPSEGRFETLHEAAYPYGDVRLDTSNVSFYVTGQFGDAVFEITRGITDERGRLWIADFLAGKLVIVESS